MRGRYFNICNGFFVGEELAEKGGQETSSVVVETVHKVSKNSKQGPVLPLFKSDASKVTSKGMGLKKAYLQKQNMFTVHCGDAGKLTDILAGSLFNTIEALRLVFSDEKHSEKKFSSLAE